MQVLNVTKGGPVNCNPYFKAPISGGPYSGFAFTIRGNADITSRSGKVAEVGRLDYTPFFLAVGQGLQTTPELPFVRGGGLKLRFKTEQKRRGHGSKQ
jgi:hypothetical protein